MREKFGDKGDFFEVNFFVYNWTAIDHSSQHLVSIRDKKLRAIYILAAIFLLILYNYFALEGTGYDPYYFIWQSK